MAKADFDKGEYQWVAEVTNTIVFADPANTDARLLCADALEQLGYQAESAPMLFDYMAIVMDKQALADCDFIMNVTLPDVDEQHMLHVKNGAMLVYKGTLSDKADVSITCPKNALFAILTNNQETFNMIAEIYHKVSSNQEDELTGNFFGTMRYLPFDRGLNQIFKHYVVSEDPRVKEWFRSWTADDVTMEFWKRSADNRVEIDAYLSLEHAGIGIEVKYQSGLSGEEQLEKEAEVIRREWCKSERCLLLLIAGEETAKNIYQAHFRHEIFKDVPLAYLTWQNVLRGLDKVITVSPFEERMVEDLRLLLMKKGFHAFEGFEWEQPRIREDLGYDFG